MPFLILGLLVALAITIAVVVGVRRASGSGPFRAYSVPYAEPRATSMVLIGGGVWGKGVRVSPPLVRLEVSEDWLRIGPASASLTFLVQTLQVPRNQVTSVEEISRPFGRKAVRFTTPEGTFAFIGPADMVFAVLTTRWPGVAPS
jgi:hypothetical protein